MYYQEYLSNLCYRRQWPEPVFTALRTHHGDHVCLSRVNNREYQSDAFETKDLARENAAMQAYWRCQNFSRNDGMHPKEHVRGGSNGSGSGSGGSHKVQGRPIAIGTERASHYSDTSSRSSRSSRSGSGGSSPTSIGSGTGSGITHGGYGSSSLLTGYHEPVPTSAGHNSKRMSGSGRSHHKHRSSRY